MLESILYCFPLVILCKNTPVLLQGLPTASISADAPGNRSTQTMAWIAWDVEAALWPGRIRRMKRGVKETRCVKKKGETKMCAKIFTILLPKNAHKRELCSLAKIWNVVLKCGMTRDYAEHILPPDMFSGKQAPRTL